MNSNNVIQFDENGLFEIKDEAVLARVVGGSTASTQALPVNVYCPTKNTVAHCGG
jgi:hypothetical protein